MVSRGALPSHRLVCGASSSEPPRAWGWRAIQSELVHGIFFSRGLHFMRGHRGQSATVGHRASPSITDPAWGCTACRHCAECATRRSPTGSPLRCRPPAGASHRDVTTRADQAPGPGMQEARSLRHLAAANCPLASWPDWLGRRPTPSCMPGCCARPRRSVTWSPTRCWRRTVPNRRRPPSPRSPSVSINWFSGGPVRIHRFELPPGHPQRPPKTRSRLEIDRRVVHNLCISRAIAACSRKLSRRGG